MSLLLGTIRDLILESLPPIPSVQGSERLGAGLRGVLAVAPFLGRAKTLSSITHTVQHVSGRHNIRFARRASAMWIGYASMHVHNL